MKISAEIKIKYPSPEELYKIFQPEISKKDRSGFKLIRGKNNLKFIIESKDSVALRATLNSITKLLTVYEKTIKILKDF